MRRVAYAVVLVLVAVGVLAGCSASKGAPENAGSEFRFVEGTPSGEVIAASDRKQAPTVTGELLDGKKYALADHHGKIVVINFWASWCAPCRVEAPDLEKTYQTYQGKGVELLGVLVRDTKGQGETYSKQAGLTYPSLFDPKTEIALQFPGYPLAAIPSTIVVDKRGRVAAAYVAQVDLASLTKTIEKLLAE
ncbi:TlpA family protein disulfide reductase [Cumulibacter manganitolerans]|uniref:TlpA family protein disulfide reductase n=1 Tax=Cumulibacter manganitolerans TaxID=1884992 RepID=UPI001295C4F4|nr:TlpA disulfide reductase family protein [Cumulibacter manganitolerans]